MISIIVCSVNPVFLEQLKENIEKTIGISYEIIEYDNRINNKGICEVYNLMAAKAKYNLLCFAHEDIIFTTQNWGAIVENTFSDNNRIGVLGIAGSKYKSAKFSGWFTGRREFDCANILHRFSYGDKKIYLTPRQDSLLEEVVCVDGVFICCRKEIWESVKFDETNLKGFHFYDIDFSVRAAKICSVAVSFRIDLTHITKGGDFGDKWVEEAIAYHQRHQHDLPLTRETNSGESFEVMVAKAYLDILKNFRISADNKRKWIGLQKLLRYPNLYYSIMKFLLYRPLQLKYVHNLFKSK